ncbi:MAG TPA: hypothetical protein PKE30_16775 [Niabella sp.]|nr:hypothetical protein [Niabella sp.]
MKNKYAAFYGVYNASQKAGNPYSKEEVILNFTNNRTSSLRELDQAELNDLCRNLAALSNKTAHPEAGSKSDTMRKAIIAIFKSMERTTQEAIKWAEGQGVKGVKKSFNDYTPGELYVLIGIAEKAKTSWMKGIRKRIQKNQPQ